MELIIVNYQLDQRLEEENKNNKKLAKIEFFKKLSSSILNMSSLFKRYYLKAVLFVRAL